MSGAQEAEDLKGGGRRRISERGGVNRGATRPRRDKKKKKTDRRQDEAKRELGQGMLGDERSQRLDRLAVGRIGNNTGCEVSEIDANLAESQVWRRESEAGERVNE